MVTAAQKGRDFNLVLGQNGVYNLVLAGLETKSVKISNKLVDVTTKDSWDKQNPNLVWQELLGVVSSFSCPCSGTFKSSAAEALALTNAIGMILTPLQLVFADGSFFQGMFLFESLEYKGDENNARKYSMMLRSSGQVTFTIS